MKAIVVLGTKIEKIPFTGRYGPSRMLQMRLDKTYEVFLTENQSRTIIIVSGGSPHGIPVTEADVMKDYLVSRGIPSCKIFKENESNNTVQNCQYTYLLLKLLYEKRLTFQELTPNFQCNYYGAELWGEIPPFDKLCVITSDFHLPRSKLIFERFNNDNLQLSFVPAPTPEDIAPAYIENEKRIMATLE